MKEQYPSQLLQNAVDAIETLPGVGNRSALRLALHLLGQPREQVHAFTAAIDKLVDEAVYCEECHMISDKGRCSICSDNRRNHRQVCVVATVRDVMSIEATGQYHGVYHVLGGIISPINGVGPSDLTIAQLVARMKEMAGGEGDTPELILALSGDVEGETTSFYIFRQLAGLELKVTALARGLGFGDNLEYADSLTLGRSIINRQIFRP